MQQTQNPKTVAFWEHIIDFISKFRDRFSWSQQYLREPSNAMAILCQELHKYKERDTRKTASLRDDWQTNKRCIFLPDSEVSHKA